MTMKRSSEEAKLDSLAMAKCLMLLSRVGEPTPPPTTTTTKGRVFECKTCNKQFASFQALGGHRASHKRPRLTAGDLLTSQLHDSPPKAKTHECSICGLEFAIGQALGGHMRKHRAVTATEGEADGGLKAAVPVLMRSSSKRVMGLDLNLSLSLMPYEASDLELDLKLGHERGAMLKCFV